MSQIFNLTKEYVQNYDLNNNIWFNFANKCDQQEFLNSQEGFYYAVKAFPQILSKLASQIKSSEARRLIIENLWEEHGQNNQKLFHTSTYYTYLTSLGFKKNENEILHNPYIDDWYSNVLNKDYLPENYSMYISGIEFIYARISYFISNLIKNYQLFCEQNHYANHSVLDYDHAKELIETSLLIQKEKNINLSDEQMMYYFKLGIEEFLTLYENMVFLTKFDAQKISQEQLAFYYSREDTLIAKNFLHNWFFKNNNKNIKPNVLMICSGGENAIEILSMNNSCNLTLLDINPNQLTLAKNKIESIKENGFLDNSLLKFNIGKFELIFNFLKNKFSEQDLYKIYEKNPIYLNKLKNVCDNIFSNEILEIIFTENATKYTKESFPQHFYSLLLNQINYYFNSKPKFSNVGSILFNKNPIDYNKTINNSIINYFNGDFLSYFQLNKDSKFDLIDLSNISDWMSFEEMNSIVLSAYENLNIGGALIGRKLLGDYSWLDFQKNLNNSTLDFVEDSTGFYKECVVIKKL